MSAKKRPMLTGISQARLKEMLRYDPETGAFTRVLPVKGGRLSGSVGGIKKGYLRICIDYANYAAHRLAWLYMTGAWPDREIDHINGVRLDNRWANLREASLEVNAQNLQGPKKQNTSGFLGVTYDSANDLWRAKITVRRKALCLGRHKTPELAHAAYLDAKRRLHEGCTI